MPLPAALLERLKKRGIVPPKVDELEEVIAEDHDSDSSNDEESSKIAEPSASSRRNYKTIRTVSGCPNKVNLYHDCTEYCKEKYGNGTEIPSPRTERKYRKLLKRFPLPLDWLDVWEPGTGRYYFWNTVTDQVSWFPPLHPSAKISLPVSKMKETMRPQVEKGSNNFSSEESNDSDSGESDSDSSEEPEPKRPTIPGHLRQPTKSYNNRGSLHQDRRPVQRNDLDPMDPASYSDTCPRGRWSDGLSAVRDE